MLFASHWTKELEWDSLTGRLGKLTTAYYYYNYIIYIGCEIYELVCMSILVFLVTNQKQQNTQADLLILGKFCSLEVVQVQSLSITVGIMSWKTLIGDMIGLPHGHAAYISIVVRLEQSALGLQVGRVWLLAVWFEKSQSTSAVSATVIDIFCWLLTIAISCLITLVSLSSDTDHFR